ncbi:MAG TPA: patatin-like phospholipase family protein [Puia sp.]|nr:patatin-like phospholipase family protein [Puia sp.]
MPENIAPLAPKTFTDSVTRLLDFLQEKFPSGDPLYISDIKDEFGRQCVDLVQEGGGVFGVALAGYTYILEKMNISFMKMAGTSAGSINTLLLASVLTKSEAKQLGLDQNKYYETRTEKVLEYLGEKNLSDFVDGSSAWRNLILKTFETNEGVKNFSLRFKRLKTFAILTAILTVLTTAIALVLNFFSAQSSVSTFLIITTFIIAGALFLLTIFWVIKLLSLRSLIKQMQKLGREPIAINPADNFLNWIKKIVEENNLSTAAQLKERLGEKFNPSYTPCQRQAIHEHALKPAALPDAQRQDLDNIDQILSLIPNNSISIDYISEQIDHLYPPENQSGRNELDKKMPEIVMAFEKRTCNAIPQKIAGPGTFTKELVIVSSDLTNEIKVEFPGMHRMYWGDNWEISPAYYVRASMSVPFFFRPLQVKYDKEQEKAIKDEWGNYTRIKKDLGKSAMFVDGGILSNFPINVFNNPNIPLPRKPTIGIKLGYNDQSSSDHIRNLLQFTGSLVSTMRFFYDRDFLLKNEIYRRTVRSVDTGNISWLNFNLNNSQKLELFFRGALTATIFLAKHRSTDAEIKKLCESGKNVPFTEAGKDGFSIYQNNNVDFKTEDLDPLVGDISFRWDQYKIERIRSLFKTPAIKLHLKNQASSKTSPGKNSRG